MKNTREMLNISYFDNKELSLKEHCDIYSNIKRELISILNKYDIKYVLAETEVIKDLQQENKQLKEKIYDLNCYLSSGDFKSNFESISNEVYIRAKIKDIIGLSMSEGEFEILKNRYFKIDIRPSFTTRKLKEAEEQLYKIKKLIGSYDEISTLENEIYRIIGDSNE